MYIATVKLLKLHIYNWINVCIHRKIPGTLDPLLIECESAVVRCEYNDKSGIIMGHLLRQSLSSSVVCAQVLVITIILLLLYYHTVLITIIIMS